MYAHVNSRSNQGKHTATIFKEQENEKKRKYNQRVMDVEMGTFTPLVFGRLLEGISRDLKVLRIAEKKPSFFPSEFLT